MKPSKYFKTVADACRYTGAKGELVFVAEDCSLRIHDGCTCGGKVLNAPGLSAEDVKAIALQCIIDNDKVIVAGAIVDGTMTLTDSQGGTVDVDMSSLVSPDEEGNYASGAGAVDVAAQTLTLETVNDETEAAGPPIVVDMSALFAALTSSPHPMFAGNGVTYDAASDTYTFTDTDTDTFGTIDGDGNITFPDGTSGNIADLDDDVDAMDIVLAGNTFTTSVGEGGATVSADMTVAVDEKALQFTDNNGNSLCFGIEHEEVRAAGGQEAPMDETTAVGAEVSRRLSMTFNVGKCPKRVRMFFYHSYYGNNPADGRAVLQPKYSVDGGAAQNFVVGGVDEVRFDASIEHGEYSFVEERTTNVLAAGAHTIEMWVELAINNLTAGDVNPNRTEGRITFDSFKQCP